MNRSQPLFFFGALAVLASAACEDRTPTTPTPDETPQAAKAGQQPQRQIRSSDDEYARVSRAEVPGFAGFYVESDGTPVILLKDHRQREAAERYLAPLIADAHVGRPGPRKAAVVRKVTHDFEDLKGWYEKIEGLMPRADIYTLDVDEVENKVSVGVRDEAAVKAVRKDAARLGVPPGALNLKIRSRPVVRATLQDRTTYLTGGIQIQGPPDSYSTRICSLGFNATSGGVPIFVTASHCTWAMFATDGATITQPTYYAGNEIGTELRDRGLYACSSTTTDLCRLSDAAYIRHTSTAATRTIGQGKIAYTATADFGTPQTNLTILNYYNIIRRLPVAPYVGLSLTKTGRTSGTTFGNITEACIRVDSETPDGRVWPLICVDESNIHSQGGDSGAPVYRRINTTDVELYGILQGGPETNFNVTFTSRLGNIEQELGALTALCVPTAGC